MSTGLPQGCGARVIRSAGMVEVVPARRTVTTPDSSVFERRPPILVGPGAGQLRARRPGGPSRSLSSVTGWRDAVMIVATACRWLAPNRICSSPSR
jgi:hypothetical protein